MTRWAVWQGTEVEINELMLAVQNNCTCAQSGSVCPMHEAILDQRILDHLLFARRVAQQLLAEELMLPPVPD